MSADDPERSLGDRFSDFLDSIGLENLTDDYREDKREADDKLERAFETGPDELAVAPDLAEVDKVNVHRDGEDVLVPVVTVVFEGTGEPAAETVWEITADVFRAVQPVFRDDHVRHYDVQFAYADADGEAAVFRRITASQDLVDEFVTDATLDVPALRERIRAGDDGDDGVPPVYWQVFDARSPAGSGSYAGAAPIYNAASCASSSDVAEVLAAEDVVYAGAAATF